MIKKFQFRTGFVVLAAAFIISISVWFLKDSSFTQPTEISIPNAAWEKIFFKNINNVTKLSNLEELRKVNLSKNDTEIRLWRGFGLSDTEGIIVRKIDNEWSAFYIKSNDYINATKTEVINLKSPQSGWQSFWNKITEAGVLTIPDASETNCDQGGIDGMSYVVEYNHEKKYRTYKYSTSYSKCRESVLLEKISNVFAEEFDNGEGICQRSEWIPCARMKRENLNNKSF